MTEIRDLAGRRVVVTGGSRGLGRAIADRLAHAGAGIHVVDLPDALADLPAGWGATACDLATPDAEAILRGLADDVARVDIVVANAGLVPPWWAAWAPVLLVACGLVLWRRLDTQLP